MVTQTWTTSKDLTKNLHRNDPMPGKESGHRNGQDSCQPQSTRTRQGASPGSKAACRAWKLQPGGGIRREMKSCKSPVTERRIPELLKLAGGGVQTDFSALSVRKTLPSGKCGRKLLPHGRRDVGIVAWGWLQGTDPGLWDVALWGTKGRQKRRGSSSREMAYAGEQ